MRLRRRRRRFEIPPVHLLPKVDLGDGLGPFPVPIGSACPACGCPIVVHSVYGGCVVEGHEHCDFRSDGDRRGVEGPPGVVGPPGVPGPSW